MQILTNFEKFQLTRTIAADFNGSQYPIPHTFNYLSELVFFKHRCHCNLCNILSRELTTRIERIKVNINILRSQSPAIPLTITQEISYILADFERFHIGP